MPPTPEEIATSQDLSQFMEENSEFQKLGCLNAHLNKDEIS
jgi:hypothetical protein